MEKQTTSEGIFVAIRMRPMNERELKSGQQAVFRCSNQVCFHFIFLYIYISISFYLFLFLTFSFLLE